MKNFFLASIILYFLVKRSCLRLQNYGWVAPYCGTTSGKIDFSIDFLVFPAFCICQWRPDAIFGYPQPAIPAIEPPAIHLLT